MNFLLQQGHAQKFASTLSKSTFDFVAYCYSLPIPKSLSIEIVSRVSNFMLALPTDEILSIESNYSAKAKLEVLKNCFTEYDSESKVINKLRQDSYFVEPTNENHSSLLVSSAKIPRHLQSCCTIQIGRVFKCFFECPGILQLALDFQKCCSKNSGMVFHFLQSPTWKEFVNLNPQDDNSVLMPMFFYYDDFESKNPLGSHKGVHKLGGTYISIPTFPPQVEANLGNLFLACIFHTILKNEVGGHAQIFKLLVECIVLLNTNGIEVSVQGQRTKLKFQLCQVLGDNLGLNSLAGYVESFSANHFCRVCKISNERSTNQCVEVPELLRDRTNFTRDIFSNDASLTGLKELSFLQHVPHFHVVDHLTLDLMHDILEGIARYEMRLIILDLISKGHITLEILNNRLQNFQFDSSENVPPYLTKDSVAKKEMLMLSASEMYVLICYFGLLIGDLVPKFEKSWELYILLRQITVISMSYQTKPTTPAYLKQLIESHHKLYLEIFPGVNLKPKHHILTHYPSKLESVGPLRHLSSFRYEAMHKKFKATAKNSASTLNLPWTLAIKFQLDLAIKFRAMQKLPDQLVLGQAVDYSIDSSLYLHAENVPALTHYASLLKNEFRHYDYVLFRCIKYVKNKVIVEDFDVNGPNFSYVESILSDGVNCLIFARKLNYMYFDNHCQAYRVEKTHGIHVINVLNLAMQKCFPMMINALNEEFVCPKIEL